MSPNRSPRPLVSVRVRLEASHRKSGPQAGIRPRSAAGVGFEPTDRLATVSGFQDKRCFAQPGWLAALRTSFCTSRPLEVTIEQRRGLPLSAGVDHQARECVPCFVQPDRFEPRLFPGGVRTRRPGSSRGFGRTVSLRWRTIFPGAWLTLESHSSTKARRLEGLLLRMRVAVVAAPECGAAWWWCALIALFGSTTPAPTRSPNA